MHENDAANCERLSTRITELETVLMHLQRTVAELDQVILAQQRQIGALEGNLTGLAAHFSALVQRSADERKPEDEKPPHY